MMTNKRHLYRKPAEKAHCPSQFKPPLAWGEKDYNAKLPICNSSNSFSLLKPTWILESTVLNQIHKNPPSKLPFPKPTTLVKGLRKGGRKATCAHSPSLLDPLRGSVGGLVYPGSPPFQLPQYQLEHLPQPFAYTKGWGDWESLGF